MCNANAFDAGSKFSNLNLLPLSLVAFFHFRNQCSDILFTEVSKANHDERGALLNKLLLQNTSDFQAVEGHVHFSKLQELLFSNVTNFAVNVAARYHMK